MRAPKARVVGASLAAAALVAAAATAPTASASDTSSTQIVYSDLYLKLIAAFPAGWVWDDCGAVVAVTGSGGVCPAILSLHPLYFHPSGTFGKMPWHADASSPTGWAVEADPCDSLTEQDDRLWADYQSFLWGYTDSAPELTDDQIALYESCWAMGF